MVEEDAIALLHPVAHEIARGKIAHAVPVRRLVRKVQEVLEGEDVRLGLHEPIALLTWFAWREYRVPRARRLLVRLVYRLSVRLPVRSFCHGQRCASTGQVSDWRTPVRQ